MTEAQPSPAAARPAGTSRRPAGVSRRPGAASRPARLRPLWLLAGVLAVAVSAVAGLAFGPVRLPPGSVAVAVLDLVPFWHLDSGLSPSEGAIVTELRLPRVVLGLLVGATLAVAGGCYQGVFRNPLADPYLLGVSAGAGLGATAAIAASAAGASGAVSAAAAAARVGVTSAAVPPAAFTGALVAVALTYALGMAGSRSRSPATLLLAGVAVTAFLTAAQTFLMQRSTEVIREVYSWLLGRLATAGWHDVLLLAPYSAVSLGVVLVARRSLDVLAVGDEEAASLGVHPRRIRYLLIVAASLGTAAAVSVSGLIGFVGIVVPHAVRLLAGTGYRVILPLAALFGGAFLTLADLAARTVLSPAEVPIGVVTALVGAPFFVVVLRTSRRHA